MNQRFGLIRVPMANGCLKRRNLLTKSPNILKNSKYGEVSV